MSIQSIIRNGLLGLGAVALAACGGGGGASSTAATTETGETITTGGGDEEVNEQAYGLYNEGVAAFDEAEGSQEGWTSAVCNSTYAKFEQALGAQGGAFTQALYMMAVVRGRCGNDEQAFELYQRSLATDESFCGARVGVGLADMRAGRDAAARQQFTTAIENDNQCTAAYVNLAILQRNAGGQEQEALNNLRRALAIESDYLPAFNQMALLYYGQAVADRSNRQMFDLAEVVCRQAQLINDRYAPIYVTWGLINMRQGNIIEALRKFEFAVGIDDSIWEAHMNLGQLNLRYRGYETARRSFTRVLELKPNDYDALVGLGMALRGLDRKDEAEARYREAMAVDTARPEAYYNLGILYQDYKSGEEGDLNQATTFYNQFSELAGNNTRYATTLENVQRQCRRVPDRILRARRRRADREFTRTGRRRPISEWQADCRPGRLQQIVATLTRMREMEEMLREAQGGADPAPAAPADAGSE